MTFTCQLTGAVWGSRMKNPHILRAHINYVCYKPTTVHSRYLAVTFFHGSNNGHTITRPLGRGMVCLLWVLSLNLVFICYWRGVCNIVLHWTAIYRESTVLLNKRHNYDFTYAPTDASCSSSITTKLLNYIKSINNTHTYFNLTHVLTETLLK